MDWGPLVHYEGDMSETSLKRKLYPIPQVSALDRFHFNFKFNATKQIIVIKFHWRKFKIWINYCLKNYAMPILYEGQIPYLLFKTKIKSLVKFIETL